MRQSAVFVWADRALFVGDRSETAVHRHHAIELCVALDDDGIDLRCPGGPQLERAPAALVRSNAAHRLLVHGPKVAVFYVDPHTALGAGLHGALGGLDAARVAPRAETRQALGQLFAPSSGLAEAGTALDALVTALAPVPARPAVDRRIRAARRLLDGRLADPPRQAEVAAHVGLSPSRLGHLFTAQTGLPMRRYILWMRLRAALTHALAGTPMTDAALLAGFSDAAHFTRTCRRMFGLPPTSFAPVDAVFIDVDAEATSSFKSA